MKNSIIRYTKDNFELEYISYPKIDPDEIIFNLSNPDFFYNIDSFFGIIAYNKLKREYTIISDMFNTFRIYYSPNMDKPYFSIFKKAKNKISEKSVSFFLKYRYIPAPLTFFDQVYTLTPGTIISLKGNTLNLIYKNKHLFLKNNISFNDFQEETEKIFNSFFDRLNSKNCAIFLSGGVDSSMIAYYAKKNFDDITAYSSVFPGERFDEKNFSDFVCKKISIEKKNTIIKKENYISFWDNMPEFFEQPVSTHTGPSYYNMLKSSDEKFIFTGYGGDELFGGDIKYSQAIKNEKFKKYLNENGIKNNIEGARDFFYDSISFFETGHKLIKKHSNILDEFIDFNLTYWQCDYENYIMNSLMRKNNKIILSPMLLPSFVKLINSMRDELKIDGYLNRLIWRKNVESVFGKDFAWRQSQGFSAPLNNIFREHIWDYVEKRVNNLLRRNFLQKIIDISQIKTNIEHFRSGGNAYNNILLLITLENFFNYYENTIYIS